MEGRRAASRLARKPQPRPDFIVHQIASAADVPGLENVAQPDDVLEFAGGSGGPLRIIALVGGR